MSKAKSAKTETNFKFTRATAEIGANRVHVSLDNDGDYFIEDQNGTAIYIGGGSDGAEAVYNALGDLLAANE
jgi:hypothetical protein